MSSQANFGPLAFLAATQVGLPVTESLQDGTAVGSFWCRVGVSVNTTPTTVTIELPRVPSFFLQTTNNGAVVYQTSADVSASTSKALVCRATSNTTATLLVA